MILQEMIESLYALDRRELRRLAAEALLISDGPDSRLLDENPGTGVLVEQHEVLKSLGHLGFVIIPREIEW